MNHPDLQRQHHLVANHSMYSKILTLNDLKVMMESHSFAVWDFMSLLKRLQREITCIELPWRPSPYPKKLVRLINEIVLGEESDLDMLGEPIDHFSLYLLAMDEIGASSKEINQFIQNLDFEKLSVAQKNFVQFNLNLAGSGKIHEVAAAFFFGREKLIPDMFTRLLSDLEINLDENDQEAFAHLKYYLVRHIQIDGEEHSHMAHDCLDFLCENDELKWKEAVDAGIKSLKLRAELWNEVESRLV
jgi:hypothetical protein